MLFDGSVKQKESAAFLEKNKALFAYHVSEPDKAFYYAMNKGIAKARGEYLLFLNAGDHFYDTSVLEKNHQLLSKEDIIYFNLQVVDKGNTFIKTYPNKLSFSYFVEDTLPHPATFIKKNAFNTVGNYKEYFKILSDWKFFIDAICKYNLSYKKIDRTLSTFYIGGMSSDPKNRNIKYTEKQSVLEQDYPTYYQDIEDVIGYKKIVSNFKRSRIISLLVKLNLLNKF